MNCKTFHLKCISIRHHICNFTTEKTSKIMRFENFQSNANIECLLAKFLISYLLEKSKNIIKQIELLHLLHVEVSCHKSINLVRYFKCIIPNVRKVAILKEIVIFYLCKLQITSCVVEIVVQMLLCVFLCPLVKLMITWNAYFTQTFSYTHKMNNMIEYDVLRQRHLTLSKNISLHTYFEL